MKYVDAIHALIGDVDTAWLVEDNDINKIKWWVNDEWSDTVPAGAPSQSAIQAKYDELATAENWSNLRTARDEKLAETDYLALSDSTLSDDMKTYRQALRDLPANTSDPTNPTWPTKPS